MRQNAVPNKRSGLPPYVRKVANKRPDGTERAIYYFQRGDFRVPVPEPSSPDFDAAYAAAYSKMEASPHFLDIWDHPHAVIANNRLDSYFRIRQQAAKGRAKMTGREFTLPRYWAADKYIAQRGVCALSGVLMRPAQGLMDPFCPTIDRINSAIGYTPENCHLVALQVNLAKNKMTTEDFIRLCRRVSAHVRKRIANEG